MPKKNIIVVESPAKAKTIEQFLGPDYRVVATFGHVRDLPKSQLGVDVEHNFAPRYVIPTKARKTITGLKKAFDQAQTIYLATDYDREGEAIAWHVFEACNLAQAKEPIHRITFHEITKQALTEAINHPRSIDTKLVDAQQARRILDRLVGYTLSPFLWKKVMKGLSAGRVQSVAVRLIVDREREIEVFKPIEYWSIDGIFTVKEGTLTAGLTSFDGKPIDKMTIKIGSEAEKMTRQLKNDTYEIGDLLSKRENKYPMAPYTTSTLQQDSIRRLRFTSKQTMKLAQDLYEAGLITYMRTDSTQIATEAAQAASKYILKEFGSKYTPEKRRMYKTKTKGAQEAHEAIRPTHPENDPNSLAQRWSSNHGKLYGLIWKRFIASQMKEATLLKTTCLISGKTTNSVFKTIGQIIEFDGFLKVYSTALEEKILPRVTKHETAMLKDLQSNQHFTEPPARYTEASLVKTLEELGVGRPSTYAPTLSTIIDRGYVKLEQRVFYPKEIGLLVTDMLKKHFPKIVDTQFTALMENELDLVATGKDKWETVLADFWKDYNQTLQAKTEEVGKHNLTKEIGENCPQCGKPLLERWGKYGKFIACSGFPDCKYIRKIVADTGIVCPECSKGHLIERRTRKGNRLFWGCDQYPACKYATWNDPTKPEKDAKTK